MDLKNRKDFLFIILAGFFISNAIVAELIGGKLVSFFGVFIQSIGIILWPIVFLLTDLINEYFGKHGVRKLTFITVRLISYIYVIITIAIRLPAVPFSPVNDFVFHTVFGQSQWIIMGSIIAFILSQLTDVYIFWLIRKATGHYMLWLRATASTAISQLVDTFVVQFVAFVIPGYWSFSNFLINATYGYIFKLLIAVLLIPLIYIGHLLIEKYLKKEPTTTIYE